LALVAWCGLITELHGVWLFFKKKHILIGHGTYFTQTGLRLGINTFQVPSDHDAALMCALFDR
jgi:hypothetical protein